MLKRLWWFWTTDRLGPDVPLTHCLLYFPRTAAWICRKKFRSFGTGAGFRPHAIAICPSRINIGNNVVIRPWSLLAADLTESGSITIEENVALGYGIHMIVNNHRFDLIDRPIKDQGYYPSKDIRVCCGSWIGDNAIILPGVTVGKNAVVGAGSIVTKDVEPYTVVAGNPARILKRIEQR